jgi:hypothetical protein
MLEVILIGIAPILYNDDTRCCAFVSCTQQEMRTDLEFSFLTHTSSSCMGNVERWRQKSQTGV